MARLPRKPSNTLLLPDAASRVDALAVRLRQVGWSVRDVETASGWRVTATHSGGLFEATAPTRLDAWRRACAQAAAMGLPGPEN